MAVSSGTAGLHLACLAANIKREDEVITSPITFVASANCILYSGGRPVFVDINQDTVCLDAQNLEGHLKRSDSRPKAVIPVHIAGLPCDMEAIKNLAEEYGLLIIEDACHAIGAEYRVGTERIKVGSCRHSDMTVFSFHPIKNITTGEGGAVLTNNPEFYELILSCLPLPARRRSASSSFTVSQTINSPAKILQTFPRTQTAPL